MLSRSSRLVLLAGCASLQLAAASCGPSELPAFANPPPDDAAVQADEDAGEREPERDG